MATSKAYMSFVMEQLSELEDVDCRGMMGEYVIYCRGKVVAGIYDDRLLLKPTKTALVLMGRSPFGVRMEVPYPGAKQMLAADVDDRDLTCRILQAIAEELPAAKPRRRPKA